MSQSKTKALASTITQHVRAPKVRTAPAQSTTASAESASPPERSASDEHDDALKTGHEPLDVAMDVDGVTGTVHIVNVANALRDHWQHKVSEETGRTGLHVTTFVSPAGWTCDRVIHYSINGYVPGPIATNTYVAAELQSRFNVGHGFHESMYRAIAEGAIHRYVTKAFAGTGLRLLNTRVEQSLPASPVKIKGTPDIVLDFGYVEEDDTIRDRFSVVVDIKTVSEKAMQRYRGTKGNINVPADYRRQVQYYIQALQESSPPGSGPVLYGAILWVVLQSPAFPSMFSLVQPDPGVYQAADVRVRRVWDLNNVGAVPDRRVGGHCQKCRFLEECQPYEWAAAQKAEADRAAAEDALIALRQRRTSTEEEVPS